MSLFSLHRVYHHAKYATSPIRVFTTPFSYNLTLRTLRTSSSRPDQINNLTQGHATNPKNVHPQDVQSQSVRGGLKARKDDSNESIDAANETDKSKEEKRPSDLGKGNPEKIGFVEQVGGASATARKFEREEREK